MKIYLPFDFKGDLRTLIRRAGYGEFNDPNTGKTSFTKRLISDYYPRFHIYIEQDRDNKIFLSLHLDQKKPSYPGAHAHSADYDGEAVEREAAKLQGLIKNQLDNQNQSPKPTENKKSFWEKLFGS